MNIEYRNRPGDNWFKIIKSNRLKITIEEFFKDNPFNIDDYYIYKATNKFGIVNKEDFFNFNYSGYIFFKKQLFIKEDIDIFIEWIYNNFGSIQYLSKPLPPKQIINRIIIKQYE